MILALDSTSSWKEVNLMFEMTSEGYTKAKTYLKSLESATHPNQYEQFLSNRTSTDGYSLIYYANTL